MPTVLTSTIQSSTMTTPIGPLTLLAVDGAVRAAGFTDDIAAHSVRLTPDERARPVEAVSSLGPITDALAAYFAGNVAALDSVPVALRGTPFQQRVWAALRAIPPGQPSTYRDLAVHLGGPALARAVGTANGANPVAPIIPCHRLVGSDGRLRGYYWTLERKRWLLDHERRHTGAGSRL